MQSLGLNYPRLRQYHTKPQVGVGSPKSAGQGVLANKLYKGFQLLLAQWLLGPLLECQFPDVRPPTPVHSSQSFQHSLFFFFFAIIYLLSLKSVLIEAYHTVKCTNHVDAPVKPPATEHFQKLTGLFPVSISPGKPLF